MKKLLSTIDEITQIKSSKEHLHLLKSLISYLFRTLSKDISDINDPEIILKSNAILEDYLSNSESNSTELIELSKKLIEKKSKIQELSKFSVNSLFVNKTNNTSYIDQVIVEIFEGGKGEVWTALRVDELMEKSVKNSVWAAFHYISYISKFSSIHPSKFTIIWQIRDFRHFYCGNSIGLAIALAILSKFAELPIDPKIAVTGSVDIDGKISRIGEINTKIEGIFQKGISKVIIPKQNIEDIQYKTDLEIIPVNHISEVVSLLFGEEGNKKIFLSAMKFSKRIDLIENNNFNNINIPSNYFEKRKGVYNLSASSYVDTLTLPEIDDLGILQKIFGKKFFYFSILILFLLLGTLLSPYIIPKIIRDGYSEKLFKTDSIGILVAQIEGDKENRISEDIVHNLRFHLQKEGLTPKVEVKSFKKVIKGEKGYNLAYKLANDTGADIIIWADRIGNFKYNPEIILTKNLLLPQREIALETIIGDLTEINLPQEFFSYPLRLASFAVGLSYYYKEKNYQKAIEYFKLAIQDMPKKDINSSKIYLYLGLSYYRLYKELKDLELLNEAEENYNEALLLSSKEWQIFNGLGIISLEKGEFDKGLNYFYKGIDINKEIGPLHTNLGILLRKIGEIDEARKELEKGVKLNPENLLAHYNLGNFYKSQGEFELALKEYNIALGIEKIPEIYNNIGAIYRLKEELNSALEAFNNAIEIDRNFSPAYYNIACIYALKGEKDNSLKWFKRAIQLGYNNKNKIISDPDISLIKDLPEFKTLIDKIENMRE